MRISDWSSDVCSSDLAAASLAARGTDCRPLNVSHAFHSARLDPILDDLQQAASRLTMRPAAIPIASNLDGCMRTAFDPRHWRDPAREADTFPEGMATLTGLGWCTFLVIAPQTLC